MLATAIALGAVTGARRGELCALRWSDVDWGRRVISIARSLTVIRAKATAGPTKTHQRRNIAIDPAIAAVLTARREHQERYAAAVGVELVADPHVLSRSSDGSAPCLPDGLSLAYAKLAERLGIVTHFQELRHFSATAGHSGRARRADCRRAAWSRRPRTDVAGLRPRPRGARPGASQRLGHGRPRPHERRREA